MSTNKIHLQNNYNMIEYTYKVEIQEKMTTNSIYDNIIASYHIPRLNEIPEIELYMDQVILYVKKYFSIFPYSREQNFITPSMINNYVKSNLIPPPNGKKYTRRHIAYIFVIFFLKQIFSLEEVKAFISLQIKLSGEKDAYEEFCNIFESELKNFSSHNVINRSELSGNQSMLHHAALSIAHKLYTQSLLI